MNFSGVDIFIFYLLQNNIPGHAHPDINGIGAYPINKQNEIKCKFIAERLKLFADKLQDQYGEEQLEAMITSVVHSQNPSAGINRFITTLQNLRGQLTWQKVGEIFRVGYRLIENLSAVLQNIPKPFEDERWTLFQSLWDFMVNTVARWVCENGGWVSLVTLSQSVYI